MFKVSLHLLCKTWFYKDCNRNWKNPVLDAITLSTSNQAIYYNLLNIYFSSLINLDTLMIMSPKIDAPYLWIRPLDLVPFKFSLRATIDHHGPSLHSGHYIASISCCKKKHFIAMITQLQSSELLTAKTPLLHMLYYMNWLTHDFWTQTGGWEFDRSNGIDTSSPSHWQQVEEQVPKPVGWMMCFLLMTFVSIHKLCFNIYMHFLYEFCFLWFTNCVLLSDDNRLIPGCLWLLAFVLNNILILGIWYSPIPHLPGCFCPWTFFQNIRFNMVPSDPFMVNLLEIDF